LVLGLSDEAEDKAEAWVWKDDDDKTLDLSDCKSLDALSNADALALEAAAFAAPAPWHTAAVRAHLRELHRPERGAQPESKLKRQKRTDDYLSISRLPCVTEFLEMARYKGKSSIDEQFSWLRSAFARKGCDWQDFIWAAQRYATSPDCRDKIDRLRNKLCLSTAWRRRPNDR
jgi:hypothetical protein